ncbi:MAG: glycerophosphodiester phosphodiesterase, partial [Cyanobacteria bacterium]|nr:glycerophosphodiester phosphodiesterase [Cyanobacteriota bacterium]
MKSHLLSGNTPFVIAHRGASSEAPENTLVSFKKAASYRPRLIELDVRLTKDGQLAIIHDPTVDRTTSGQGLVETFTMDDLRALDAGYRFSPDGRSYPYRGTNVTVPSLSDVLAEVPQANFLIEPKGNQKELLTRLVQVLTEHNAFGRVIVTLIGLKHAHARDLRKL